MSRRGGLRALATVMVAALLALLAGTAAQAAAGQNSVAPGFYRVTWSQGMVTLYWTDNSDNEAAFSMQDGGTGNWRQLAQAPTRDQGGVGGNYAWTDPTQLTVSDGDRCYRVVLAYFTGGQTPGISETRCLRADSPPPDPPSPAAQPTNTDKALPTSGTTPTNRASPITSASGSHRASPSAGTVDLPDFAQARDRRQAGPEDAPVRTSAASDTSTNGPLLVGAGTLTSAGLLVGGLMFLLRRRRTAPALTAPPGPGSVHPAGTPPEPWPAAPAYPEPWTPSVPPLMMDADLPPAVDPWADPPA